MRSCSRISSLLLAMVVLASPAAAQDVECLIPGDYSWGSPPFFVSQGIVGQVDLDVVLINWGTPVPPDPPLFDCSPATDFVGQNELDDVLIHWGDGLLIAPTVGVPEPSALMLIGVAATMLVCPKRHCRARSVLPGYGYCRMPFG